MHFRIYDTFFVRERNSAKVMQYIPQSKVLFPKKSKIPEKTPLLLHYGALRHLSLLKLLTELLSKFRLFWIKDITNFLEITFDIKNNIDPLHSDRIYT